MSAESLTEDRKEREANNPQLFAVFAFLVLKNERMKFTFSHMCGRFTQTKTREEVLEQLAEIELPPLFHGRYNVAPTQQIPVIDQNSPNRTTECIWGFENPKSGGVIINARSETLNERPMFNCLFSTNRCLIPADGFYEWKGRQPYFFQLESGAFFAFAGLWNNGRCVIMTRAADENMRGFHDRMPVIVLQEQWKNWLHSPFPPPAPPHLKSRPVSPLVNRVGNDCPECIEPAAVQADLFLFPGEE